MSGGDSVELIFYAAIGACIGGVLTVMGLRLPRGNDAVTPLSKLIYPVMMLLGSVSFLLAAILVDVIHERIAGMVLIAILIALTVSDLQYRLLPNRIIYPALLLFTCWRLMFHPLPLWAYALGFLAGGGLLYGVSFAAVKLRRPAMGGGDIKLMALLGLVMGIELVLVTILLSSLLAVLTALLLIAARRLGRRDFIPYGPFISAAAVTAWLYGEAALSWYYRLWI